MVVLFTWKNEEDLIKNEGARVLTTLYINFSDVQGQITLELVVVSGRNLNSSKLSCMSSLPARVRMIDSKMKELECSQDFSHYKSMGIFPDTQGQLTPQSLVRSGRISNSSEMLWMFLLPASMKKIRSKMKALECSQHFPHYNPMGAIRCHGHQSSDPIWPQNLMQPFPHPNDGSDKISLRLAHWLRRYSSLKMFTDTHTHTETHTQTTARLVYYKLTFEPSAQVS